MTPIFLPSGLHGEQCEINPSIIPLNPGWFYRDFPIGLLVGGWANPSEKW
jgi:hypothetical protein